VAGGRRGFCWLRVQRFLADYPRTPEIRGHAAHRRIDVMPIFRVASAALVFALVMNLQGCASRPLVAYVSNADSAEIAVVALNRDSGALQQLQSVPAGGTVMPLALSPDRATLYAALRNAPYRVVSFRIAAQTGWLTPLAEAPLPESMPNIATDRSGRYLLAASYGGSLFSVSPLQANGAPGPAQQTLPTGLNAHAAVISPDNRYVFVTNLNADQVMQLRFDAATGLVQPNTPAELKVRAKSGPRHLVFHPSQRWAYLLNELDATVDLLAYDAAAGTLTLLKSWSMLPPGFKGRPWAADLHLTPDGRFLYTSERTSSTLVGWKVDAASGELSLVGHTATEQGPRGFQIDPSGNWLLAAGQVSNGLSSYRINRSTGVLTHAGSLRMGKGSNWVEIVELR
jgi:6-phosphogluconolactonase